VVHVLPLWKTGAAIASGGLTLPRAGTALLLVAFLAFFILKACGRLVLHLHGRGASLIALLVIFGLVHGNDVGEWAKDPGHHVTSWAILSSAAGATATRSRLRRRLAEFLTAFRSCAQDLLRPALSGAAPAALIEAPVARCRSPQSSPRGPPPSIA
jgi:hypothetical protein